MENLLKSLIENQPQTCISKNPNLFNSGEQKQVGFRIQGFKFNALKHQITHPEVLMHHYPQNLHKTHDAISIYHQKDMVGKSYFKGSTLIHGSFLSSPRKFPIFSTRSITKVIIKLAKDMRLAKQEKHESSAQSTTTILHTFPTP